MDFIGTSLDLLWLGAGTKYFALLASAKDTSEDIHLTDPGIQVHRKGSGICVVFAGGHLPGTYHAKYQHVHCGQKLQENWHGTQMLIRLAAQRVEAVETSNNL